MSPQRTTLTYNGLVAGTGELTKIDTGVLVLGGVNTFNGVTTIAGTLSISADTNLGTVPGSATPGSLVINGGTLASTTISHSTPTAGSASAPPAARSTWLPAPP